MFIYGGLVTVNRCYRVDIVEVLGMSGFEGVLYPKICNFSHF